MIKYRFSLVKTILGKRFRTLFKQKVVFVGAPDLSQTREKVYLENLGWEVSMFWPV